MPPEALRLERAIAGIGIAEFEQTYNPDGSTKQRNYWLTPEEGVRRRRIPSVTGILRDTWPPGEGLKRWWMRFGTDAPAMLLEASIRGTDVHRFIETFLTTGEILDLDTFPEAHLPYLQGAARFLFDYDPKPLAIEQLVVHPEMGFAGRPDLVCLLADEPELPTLVDFKSNPEGRIYPEAHVQTTAYAIARERCGDQRTERTLLVGLDGEGGYHTVTGYDVPQAWGAVLALYGQIKRLEKALNGGPS